MEFIDHIRVVASRIPTHGSTLLTEEATKNALIMPFIMALGYNVFDPAEVTPEIVADIGVKKGEKVDYAILKDGKPVILFECKKCGADLGSVQASQLFRYFTVTDARFGILTNGVQYRFYSDLEQANKMDLTPFWEFDLGEFKDQDIEQLRKFAKDKFDMQEILNTAADLKFTRAIQKVLTEQLANPSEEFVRVVTAPVYPGRMTPAAKQQFAVLTKRAFQQFIADRINDRLKAAMEGAGPLEEREADPTPVIASGEAAKEQNVQTTDEEREAFYIVRAIARERVAAKRVVMRDAQSYCAILLDDNNRKTICRLYLNSPKKKYIAFLDNKSEERLPIADISDIYQYADRIDAAVALLSGATAGSKSEGEA
jgi:hypothetical protein